MSWNLIYRVSSWRLVRRCLFLEIARFLNFPFFSSLSLSSFLLPILSCPTRVKSTSCRRVLSSSFIAATVGSGIILDNFTASRGDREERGDGQVSHKWSLHQRRLWKLSFPGAASNVKRLLGLWYHGFSMRRTALRVIFFAM